MRYKFLRLMENKIRSNSGDMTWQIGAWQEVQGQPEMCSYGLHCSEKVFDAFSYVKGEIVAHVEVAGEFDKGDDKEAWQKMRITQAWYWRKEDSVALAIYAADELLHKLEAEIASVDATLEKMKVEFGTNEQITVEAGVVYAEVVNIQHDLQAKWLRWRLDRLEKALVKFYGKG